MKLRTPVLLLLFAFIAAASPARSIRPVSVADIPTPSNVLGFAPGDDRKLASWSQVLEYFEQLDRASDRVIFETLGQTSMGKPFVMATISAPEKYTRDGQPL